ncbi:MAG: DUF4038 domain-containing protein, partial [Acidobacteriota bacterium]|nr:DUF4038 domain-containing protein [Acidobacteriota bacterium]
IFAPRHALVIAAAMLTVALTFTNGCSGGAGGGVSSGGGSSSGDHTPPTVSITSPANNATLSGTVVVTASATDDVAVASVQFQVDNTAVGPALTSAPYSYSLDTTTLTNGTHTLTAVAVDTSNNTAKSAAISITVSNAGTPPAVKFPIKAASGGRYFVDQNGQPFMIVADAGHHLISAIPQSSWAAYLSDRQTNGFTAVDVYAVCSGSGASGRCPTNAAAYNGSLPFNKTVTTSCDTAMTGPSDADVSCPNNAYWTEVDTLVQDAATAGLVVILDPLPWGDAFSTTIINNGSSKDYAFGQFIGNRYKNDTNIIYMLGDDFDQSSFPSDANIGLVAQIMAGIQSVDTNHLITCQLNYNLSWSTQANSHSATFANILTMNLLYDYFQTYDGASSAWNSSTLPIWMGEANYETANNTGGLNQSANAFITRLQSWYTMTSGGAGFEFGNEHVNHFDSGYASTSGPCSPTTCLDSTATLQQKYIPALFSTVPWQTFKPDQSHTVVTSGYGTYNSSTDLNLYDATYATTTWDGSTTSITYTPVSTTLTVNLGAFSHPVTAAWFDPTTGTSTTISGSPFTNSGSQSFTTPAAAHADGTQDWVLVLH